MFYNIAGIGDRPSGACSRRKEAFKVFIGQVGQPKVVKGIKKLAYVHIADGGGHYKIVHPAFLYQIAI